MQRRTVEATRRRYIKRIKRIEDKQRRLIDRLVYDELSTKKVFFLKIKIKEYSKRVALFRREIEQGARQSKGKG